jgi:hypothetical protein
METKNLRKVLESWIKWKARSDEKFRHNFLKNPESTIETVLGLTIPESVNIRVLEEKDDEFYIVLPHIHHSEDELTELEMESVAGGWTGDCNDTDCNNCPGGTFSCGGPP